MLGYYYIVTSLPTLTIGMPPEISFAEFDNLLVNNLSSWEYSQTQVIRRYYDIQNIKAFWLKEPLDPRGNYNFNQLEEALLNRTGFPKYVYKFLDEHEELEARLSHFPELISAYFREESSGTIGFLKEYLQLEREMRLVLTGFRAKKLGRDPAIELQFEDPDDPIVAQILAQKNSPTYEPPSKYEDLKPLFEENYDSPLALHQALCEYKFEKVESMFGLEIFTLRRILAYMVQLILAEKWMELDKEKGMKVVETILKEAS